MGTAKRAWAYGRLRLLGAAICRRVISAARGPLPLPSPPFRLTEALITYGSFGAPRRRGAAFSAAVAAIMLAIMLAIMQRRRGRRLAGPADEHFVVLTAVPSALGPGPFLLAVRTRRQERAPQRDRHHGRDDGQAQPEGDARRRRHAALHQGHAAQAGESSGRRAAALGCAGRGGAPEGHVRRPPRPTPD